MNIERNNTLKEINLDFNNSRKWKENDECRNRAINNKRNVLKFWMESNDAEIDKENI